MTNINQIIINPKYTRSLIIRGEALLVNKTLRGGRDNFNFTGEWISGFTQSDGSFVVSFENKKEGMPIRPRPVFNLTQSIEELEMFIELQKYLGVGKVQKNRNNVTFVVTSIEEIIKVIIPLFDKYSLRGSKLLSFQIFKEISLMMKDKKHLTLEGTLQIIECSYFMNKETSLRTEVTKETLIDKLRLKYGILPVVSKISVPKPKTLLPMTLEFIRGLIDGDGSFNVSFRTERRRIGANFTVVTELSSISVLDELVEFFKCGSVYRLPSVAARYQVQTVDEILNKIAPVLNTIKFNTKKQNHYEITIKVCELIKTKGYKTDEDLKAIVDLAWDMNNSGKNRKISKDQYLSKFISS